MYDLRLPLYDEVDCFVRNLKDTETACTTENTYKITAFVNAIGKHSYIRGGFLSVLVDSIAHFNRYLPFSVANLEPLYEYLIPVLRNVYIGDCHSRSYFLSQHGVSLLFDPMNAFRSNPTVLANAFQLLCLVLCEAKPQTWNEFRKGHGFNIISAALTQHRLNTNVTRPALDLLWKTLEIEESTVIAHVADITKLSKALVDLAALCQCPQLVLLALLILSKFAKVDHVRHDIIKTGGVQCVLTILQWYSNNKDISVQAFLLLARLITDLGDLDDVMDFDDDYIGEDIEDELTNYAEEGFNDKALIDVDLVLQTIHQICKNTISRVFGCVAFAFVLRVLNSRYDDPQLVISGLDLLSTLVQSSDYCKDRTMDHLNTFQSISTVHYNNSNLMRHFVQLFILLVDGMPDHLRQIQEQGGIEFFVMLLRDNQDSVEFLPYLLNLFTILSLPQEDTTLVDSVHAEIRQRNVIEQVVNSVRQFSHMHAVVSGAMQLLGCLCFDSKTENIKCVAKHDGFAVLLATVRQHIERHIEEAKWTRDWKGFSEVECQVYLSFCEAIPSFPADVLRQHGAVSLVTSMHKWFQNQETIANYSARALIHLVGESAYHRIVDEVTNWRFKENIASMWSTDSVQQTLVSTRIRRREDSIEDSQNDAPPLKRPRLS